MTGWPVVIVRYLKPKMENTPVNIHSYTPYGITVLSMNLYICLLVDAPPSTKKRRTDLESDIVPSGTSNVAGECMSNDWQC